MSLQVAPKFVQPKNKLQKVMLYVVTFVEIYRFDETQ